MKRAVDEVSYENLDGPVVKRALEGEEFDVDGMVKISFGPEDRGGHPDVRCVSGARQEDSSHN